MRILSIIILICFPSILLGQMEFSFLKHDFGELESYDNRFVDVTITNKTPKQGYILSVRKPAEIVYIQNHALVEKDSSITLRFQVNPRQKGRFAYEITVFTIDQQEPTILKLSGNLKDLPNQNGNSLTACPDFNSHPAGKKSNEFDLTVITIDASTKTELSESSVTMIQNGSPIWSDRTDKKGKIKKDATLGLSYFFAKHEGYLTAELGTYVNTQRNVVVIELAKDPSYCLPPPITETELIVETVPEPEPTIEIILEEKPTPQTETQVTEILETHLQNEVVTTSETPIPPALTELENDNFDETYFNPINVTFVLDISSSMNQSEKMELMKYSLIQLTEMLRPQDRISLVTYATDTRVILPPTAGTAKEEIISEVQKLKASGMTAGGEGIKLGFKQANAGYIPNGVNHVIVITDGAFNRNSDDYKNYIKKNEKKGIKMSIVGIRNQEKDEEAMRQAAKLGGGTYIPIFKLVDAQNNLKQAIRVMCFK